MIRTIAAVALGLACFTIPDLCLARPMTEYESRCFEASEAVYQAAEPRGWDKVEPDSFAEWLSERSMIECLDREPVTYSYETDDDIYEWENYTCK